MASKGMDDCFSRLPDDILSFVLSFVTVRDAVRLSSASRSWKNIYASMSHLHFDLSTTFGISREEDCSLGFLREHSPRLAAVVDQFLHNYMGTNLKSFRVCLCYEDDFACLVDNWIELCTKMAIEEIILSFKCCSRSGGRYKFPFHLLPVGRASHLKHLCLKICLLKLPLEFADRFWSLKTLDLNGITLQQSDIECIFSGCRNIESLCLQSCSLPNTLCVDGRLLCLKSLVLLECSGLMFIELNSINLETFDYNGCLISITFIRLPLLISVRIWGLKSARVLNNLAKDLLQLQSLSVFFSDCVAREMASSMIGFGSLKVLDLHIMYPRDSNLLTIARLINASPFLQIVHIALFRSFEGDRGRQMPEVEFTKHPSFHLKQVKLSGFSGVSNEMELATYFLNIGAALELMILTEESDHRTPGMFNSVEHKRIFHEELQYRKTYDSLEPKKKKVHDLLFKEKLNPLTDIVFLPFIYAWRKRCMICPSKGSSIL